MIVKLTSNLYTKSDLSGEYEVDPATPIVTFLDRLGLEWDNEALVVVNDSIVDDTYELQEGDHIYLLTPIFGG